MAYFLVAVSGVFAEWQPLYAKHQVATFPVQDKRPSVRHWQKVGLRGSSLLAAKFPEAEAFGFMCGPRNGITLIDVDSKDEHILAEAIDLFGESPIIWQTGSGNYAMPFRHNGEARRIRPIEKLPIDVLGGGFAVAPPSIGAKGRYVFLRGDLDDLDHLPVIRDVGLKPRADGRHVPQGKRNNTLFRFALEQAHHVDDFETLLDVLRTRNSDCELPLAESEILSIANSAWRYQQQGRNLVGQGRAMVVDHTTFDLLMGESPDAWQLYSQLKRHHWGRDFALANAMAKSLHWGLPRFRRARDILLRLGIVSCKHRGGKGRNDPPVFSWTKAAPHEFGR